MSITIDAKLCTGCGQCLNACPCSLLETGAGGTAEIGRPEDCWGCAACLKACPNGAVSLYLAASLGGRGSRLTVKSGHRLMHWRVTAPDGATQAITVNSGDADNY